LAFRASLAGPAHWGYIIAGTVRVHGPNNTLDYEAGQAYYWEPGHNIEAVIDAEYVEISRAAVTTS
jgi:hypothetical protein